MRPLPTDAFQLRGVAHPLEPHQQPVRVEGEDVRGVRRLARKVVLDQHHDAILVSEPVLGAGYRLEPAAKIRRSRYKSRTRGTTNTTPHQRPVAQSTTTTTVIQMASSSRITSDDFRCRRSQFILVERYLVVAIVKATTQVAGGRDWR